MQCSVPQSNPRSNLWAQVGSSRHWDWRDMDRQTDGCYPPNLGKTPKPLAHHWALPCIKTCLWFRVCDLPPQPRRKGGSTASGILMGGGIFLNVAFLQCFEGSQPGEMHVPRLWLCTLNLPEKKNPKPILQTLIDGKVMEEPQLQQHAGALTSLLLPCHFGSFQREKIWK